MLDYRQIVNSLGMSEEEEKFSNLTFSPAGPGKPVAFVQKENVLRRRGWGFVWDARYWEYQRPVGDPTDLMMHQCGGFFGPAELGCANPPWYQMLLDLREVTMWTPTNKSDSGLLLPVKEA